MWSAGQVWRAKKPVGVWLDDCLEWKELVHAGRARVLPEGALLLVLVETATLVSDKQHTYHSSYCLDLFAGELVYHISNVSSLEPHAADYERIV